MRKAILLLSSTLLMSVVAASNARAQEGAEAEAKAETETTTEKVHEAGDSVQEKLGIREPRTGYGPAGCGLGSIIFEPDSGFTQIFAATTNGTFGTQTFGITTGTSNCDTGTKGSASTKAFVAANRSVLAKDIARGSGETLGSVSRLAGCENTAAVGPTLQRNFSQIFPNGAVSDQEVGDRVLDVLRSSGELRCKNVS
ncbi:MAG: DUF3015 family protein [Polyangiaceae bacterium]